MAKTIILFGSILAFLGVALGAFGTHGLKTRIASDLLDIYQTGVQYHLIHALAVILTGLVLLHVQNPTIFQIAGWCFIGGIFVFSGSLYLLAITNVRILGAITPIGGLAFLAGWLLITWGTFKHL